MRYRKFGNTGLSVSELCLGTTIFAGSVDGDGGVPQAQAGRLVGRAIDAGINFIDAGAAGGAELITGRALRDLQAARDRLVVATQFPAASGGGSANGASRYAVMDAVIASLRRLRLDHIDLYRIDGFDRATPVEEAVRALEHLVQRGRLRCVGVSNRAARQIMDALGISVWLELDHFEPVEAL
ncbi:MAG TPA: aldo/keto reductase, partial [Nevskia sp.]|nr:aldo/keto reductase [Nevskia sp.]